MLDGSCRCSSSWGIRERVASKTGDRQCDLSCSDAGWRVASAAGGCPFGTCSQRGHSGRRLTCAVFRGVSDGSGVLWRMRTEHSAAEGRYGHAAGCVSAGGFHVLCGMNRGGSA